MVVRFLILGYESYERLELRYERSKDKIFKNRQFFRFTNSEQQDDTLFSHFNQIFVMYSIHGRKQSHPHWENGPRANLGKGPD